MNGATGFDAFRKRVTHGLDRKADADSYNYAAEFVAVNGLLKAIGENLEATLEARSSVIDAACPLALSGWLPRVRSFAAFSCAAFPLSLRDGKNPAVLVCPRLLT